MRTCRRCLYTDHHPLNIVIDDEGICSGCRIHEEKDLLNWEERGEKLRTILNQYKNAPGKNYDCIIPVSGARDSYFIVDTIKNKYGMNPLLVTYNKQYNTAAGIRNLANLKIRFDCDVMSLTVNPEKLKRITRATLRRFGSLYWHCLAGQTVFPVQLAVKLKIPLIVWGAHQGVDQVGMYSHLNEVEMTRKYRKEHDLMGFEAEDLIDDEYDNVTLDDVFPFIYPDDKEIEHVGVRGIYLNNYIRWDSKAQHEKMIVEHGYESAGQNRTFDTYNDVDCWNYSDIHDYLKFIKHGYGKVVDHANREIRLRRLTREQGAALVDRYIHNEPQHLDKFLHWLGIKENAFWYVVNQHRNSDIWTRNADWKWELKRPVYVPVQDTDKLPQLEVFTDFIVTPEGKSTDHKDEYIIIGKGQA